MDAGASARSADRPGLQALLARLRDKSLPPVSYVIVHKLDRLVRNRADDVELLLAIRAAGAQLVSVTENIDESPSGMLVHGIMASIAEFYSHNLSTEAKKGIAEKAKRGGSIGYAPTGYRNTTTRMAGNGAGGGHEVKSVEIDPARGPHIAWAFEHYADGNISLSDLVSELAARGLTSRDSRASGGPLQRSSVHRILSNPYYVGRVRHRGMEYPGQHEPLVDEATFNRVQEMLADRKKAGDRSWRLTHYLKGLVFCARCGSRLGYSRNTGRGGSYEYFFCLGKARKRNDCDLPYLRKEVVEELVVREWHKLTLSDLEIAATRRHVRSELTNARSSQSSQLTAAEKEVLRLSRTKQRLLDAYLAEAVELTDFQTKQGEIATQLAHAQTRLDALGRDYELVEARVELVLSLLERAGEFYEQSAPVSRAQLNQAVFTRIRVGAENDPTQGELTDAVESVVGTEPEAGNGPAHNPGDEPHGGEPALGQGSVALLATTRTEGRKTPNPRQSPDEGSNVMQLAEREGFEPSEPCGSLLFESSQFNHSCTSP